MLHINDYTYNIYSQAYSYFTHLTDLLKYLLYLASFITESAVIGSTFPPKQFDSSVGLERKSPVHYEASGSCDIFLLNFKQLFLISSVNIKLTVLYKEIH